MFKRKKKEVKKLTEQDALELSNYFDIIDLRKQLMTLEDQVLNINTILTAMAADVAALKAVPANTLDLTAVESKLDMILAQFNTTPAPAPVAAADAPAAG